MLLHAQVVREQEESGVVGGGASGGVETTTMACILTLTTSKGIPTATQAADIMSRSSHVGHNYCYYIHAAPTSPAATQRTLISSSSEACRFPHISVEQRDPPDCVKGYLILGTVPHGGCNNSNQEL